MAEFKRTIKYEAELKKDFTKEVIGSHGCEGLSHCIQCGNCSGICPVSIYMDYPPRKIIAMVREGFKDEVLSSKTIWLCASCYACAADCPQNIKITDIMYKLKRMAIKEGKYPKKIATAVLAKTFYNMLRSSGRNTESWLVLTLWLKTSIMKMFTNAGFGLSLMSKGRLSFGKEEIKNKDSFHRLLEEVEK